METDAWWTQVNTCCRIKWQLSTGDWELSPPVIPCETWHSTLSTVFYVLRLLHNPCKRLNLTHFQSLSRHTARTSVCGQHHQYEWQAGNRNHWLLHLSTILFQSVLRCSKENSCSEVFLNPSRVGLVRFPLIFICANTYTISGIQPEPVTRILPLERM